MVQRMRRCVVIRRSRLSRKYARPGDSSHTISQIRPHCSSENFQLPELLHVHIHGHKPNAPSGSYLYSLASQTHIRGSGSGLRDYIGSYLLEIKRSHKPHPSRAQLHQLRIRYNKQRCRRVHLHFLATTSVLCLKSRGKSSE